MAFPVGGANGYAYVVMQLHYDNPRAISGIYHQSTLTQAHTIGVVDNSGTRFYYSNTARKYNAGIMQIGHQVVLDMMIPPQVSNYTVVGLCPTECIQVRGSNLHAFNFMTSCGFIYSTFQMKALKFLPTFFIPT